MIRSKNVFSFTALLLITTFCLQESVGSQQQYASLEIEIPYIPSAITIHGKPSIYYELHLRNSTGDSVKLKTLRVMDTADSAVLVSFDQKELQQRSVFMIASDKNKRNGVSTVIYVECTLPDAGSRTLIHHLVYETKRTQRDAGYAKGGTISITAKPPWVLGTPLSGGPWAAVYDPSWERGHRRVIFTMNDSARIPGRYAIDFIRMNKEGHDARGEENEVKNWFGYSADVLAVADGIIASARDDFSESATLSAHPAYPPEKATGNYISLALGNHAFAFYEHLKPGSIKVKPGQQVKKGMVIASLGFTGQSTGPHLHFHLANANSPLGAEGIPFVFSRFTLLGAYPDFSSLGKAVWEPVKEARHSQQMNERPGPNTVIIF